MRLHWWGLLLGIRERQVSKVLRVTFGVLITLAAIVALYAWVFLFMQLCMTLSIYNMYIFIASGVLAMILTVPTTMLFHKVLLSVYGSSEKQK